MMAPPIGGKLDDVLHDVEILIPRFKDLGLEVNSSKYNFFSCGVGARIPWSRVSAVLRDLKGVSPLDFTLLGSPIFLNAVPGTS